MTHEEFKKYHACKNIPMTYEIYETIIDDLRFYCINDIANMYARNYNEYLKISEFLEAFCDC